MSRIFFAFLLPLVLFSCKKEQPQPSLFNEGCSCAHEVSADFTIKEIGSLINQEHYSTETDSTYSGRNVRFYAAEDNATYTWYIGSETLHTREVTRYFDNSFIGQTIDITLVVQKTPNLICYPFDDGYDSIIKHFVVVEELNYDLFHQLQNPRLEGVFRMKNENSSDSLDITIEFLASGEAGPGAFSLDRYNIYNLDGSGSITLCSDSEGINYRQIWFHTSGYQEVSLHHNINNTVELEFTPIPNWPMPNYFFKGRKIS